VKIAAALAALLIACASSEKPQVAAPPAPQVDTTLGPGDTFEVTVYGEEDLSGKHRIAEDGTIDFPLVGRMKVEGSGAAEIANAIRDALTQKQILRDPQVSVFLLERTSKQVSVIGAVSKPGTYPLTNGMTVIEAVGAAGGLTALASGNDAIITRRVGGELKRFKVAVEAISEGRKENLELQGGDILFVPERIF
jgi:polysaccharide export outer membrane protein